MSLTKVLMYKERNPEKPKILLQEETGVAAININGINIHTSLDINIGSKMYLLNDCQKEPLCNRL